MRDILAARGANAIAPRSCGEAAHATTTATARASAATAGTASPASASGRS